MLKENNNIAYFNLLKFIGAFAIAIFYHWNGHFLPSLGLENPYSELPVIGFLSQKCMIFVEMYFIISGYLFALVYRDKIEQKQITFKTFLINRIVRIYPMMTISTLFMYLSNHYLFAYNGSLWSYGHRFLYMKSHDHIPCQRFFNCFTSRTQLVYMHSFIHIPHDECS